MVTRMTPITGQRGQFTVAAPFKVDTKISYGVTAVRRFSEILGRGEDVFKNYYEPMDLAREVYEEHLKANACIVTLQPEYDAPLFIPDTYITSIPKSDGYTYRRIIIGADTKAIPAELDLSYVQVLIQNILSDTIGVVAEITLFEIPLDDVVSEEQHAINEATRKAAIKSRDTIYADNVTLKKQNQDLLETQARLIAMLDAKK